MPMTKYERERVAEFYGNAVADILSSFLSAAEKKEKCRPDDETPKAADRENYAVDYSIAHETSNVKDERSRT